MMSNFCFRRKENKEFKHIAHGLIPAATIAPKPAVPRTPPPRSPYPSPERPRSALAAAILSSSLTGRTIAIPPTRQRSLSESDCSRSETHLFEPYASTAPYTREQFPLAGRPHLPLPGHSDEEFEDDEEKGDVERESLSEDLHVYQSLDRPGISPIYALPIKRKGAVQSEGGEETDDSAILFSPQPTEEIDIHQGNVIKRLSSCGRSMASPDLTEDRTGRSSKAYQSSSRVKATVKKNFKSTRNGHLEASQAYREVLDVQKEMVKALTEQNQGLAAERRSLEEKCTQKSLQLQRSHERLQQMEQELSKVSTTRWPAAGEQAELVSLRQQAQELVDENDSLKMTVHRLSVELSRYQTQFRPLSREEVSNRMSSRISGLPPKGSAPPWLLDIKYLSPLLLAYEDRLNDKDALLQLAEERLRKFRERVKEVVHENEKLHEELGKTGGITHKEWKQLQEQAALVLQENQVLIEQLEVQHAKAKDSHSRHHTEVSKVSKQLMLLEAEKQKIEGELEATQRKFNVLQAQHLQTCSNMENTVSWDEHCTIASKLKRQLEYEEGKKNCEVAELLERVSSLQTEKNNLVLEKTNLTADIRSREADLELSRQASRKTKKKISVLKQQMEDSMEKEMAAHHYLASIVALAEKTTLERDQLMHMASTLEQDKKGVLNRVVEGTLCLGKLQEKVKVYKKKAATSLGVLGRRLQEQEEDFAGKAASYQREIHHLQRLLQDKQEALDRVLLHKREVEGELEVVWQAATKENRRIRKSLLDYNPVRDHQSLGFSHKASPTWPSQPLEEDFTLQLRPESSSPPPFASLQSTRSGLPGLQRSPMFESDSDQHPNNSSDESEKNGHDFYS